MDAFQRAFELVIGHEGGYVNDPRDPGGETRWGISKRAHPEEDIKNLTKERAREIYRDEYWNPTAARIYDIAPRLATALFDAAVNQGNGFAVQALQGLVHVKQDGIIGPNTLSAVQDALDAHGEDWLIAQFMAQRVLAYARNRNWSVYGFGWMVRVMKTLQHVSQKPAEVVSAPPAKSDVLPELLDQIFELVKVARSEIG